MISRRLRTDIGAKYDPERNHVDESGNTDDLMETEFKRRYTQKTISKGDRSLSQQKKSFIENMFVE